MDIDSANRFYKKPRIISFWAAKRVPGAGLKHATSRLIPMNWGSTLSKIETWITVQTHPGNFQYPATASKFRSTSVVCGFAQLGKQHSLIRKLLKKFFQFHSNPHMTPRASFLPLKGQCWSVPVDSRLNTHHR